MKTDILKDSDWEVALLFGSSVVDASLVPVWFSCIMMTFGIAN